MSTLDNYWIIAVATNGLCWAGREAGIREWCLMERIQYHCLG